MRIGVMLRCIDERGGIGIYARNIVEELLRIDQHNAYVLYFRSEQHLDRYAAFPNVTTRLVRSWSKALWDQLWIPLRVARDKVDLLFNPKFTLPLFTRAKTVMVVHGADWFLPEYRRLYHPLDVLYIRLMMPLYFRRAAAVISASNYSTRGFVEHLPSCRDKIKTIYYAHKRIFRPIADESVLGGVRQKYGLPERFILTVIHYDTGRKNFANMLQAYRLARQRGIPQKFVVCGRDVERYAEDRRFQGMGLGDDVLLKGWVEQEDLPGMYNSADLYLYPTRIEAFPIPVSEAMACGCPIVTSKDAAFAEVAGDAAVFVDPESPAEIADGILRTLGDPELRQRLKLEGIERSKSFSWERCASLTLALFESLTAL
jgi:glycosyltransferase involved in cell wall biosynthesis